MKIAKSVAVVSVALASLNAHAGVIVGGSTLLDAHGVTQLENWLGSGPLTLTNIFTKHQGSTSYDFHAAADGKGATFVLMSVSVDGRHLWKTVGGYNPASWNSYEGLKYSADPSDWTAFLFNLTDGIKKTQTDGYQTVNARSLGPSFGVGPDLSVNTMMNQGLSYGWSYDHYSKKSIVDGSYGLPFNIGALEVFTLAPYTPQAVPEPGSIAILGLGLAGLAASRRKAARQG